MIAGTPLWALLGASRSSKILVSATSLLLLLFQFQLASSSNTTFLLTMTLPFVGLYNLYALDCVQ